MLLSSLFLIVLAILTDRIEICLLLLVYALAVNIYKKNNLVEKVINSRYVIVFVVFTAIFQIVFNNNGKVVVQIFQFVLTYEGFLSAGLTSLKIFCIMALAWSIDYKKIDLGKINYRYALICRTSVKIIPEVLPFIKKKFSFKYILFMVYRKVIKEINKDKR